MTISISRQPRFQRFLVLLGLVAVLIGATVALVQIGNSSGSAADPLPNTNRVTASSRETRFESIQDDFLVPTVVLAERATAAAILELQDGYLPPASLSVPAEPGMASVQDGFLPPDNWTASSEENGAARIGSQGPQ